MPNPLFNMLNGMMGNMNANNPGFMQMINQLNQFRSTVNGNPKQMVMNMVNQGQVNQQQLNMAQQMATQIQRFMTGGK